MTNEELEKYTDLVRSIAWAIYREGGQQGGLADLVQEGWCGLLEAESRFDPQRGVQLSTFAVYRIRGAILDYCTTVMPLIRLSRALRQQLAEVDRARAQLRQQHGQEPTMEQVAEALGIAPETLHEREKDRPVRMPLEEVELQASGPSPEAEAAQQERLGQVRACVEALPPTGRAILILRWQEALPPRQVAQRLQQKPETIYRTEQAALRQLRACLRHAGWTLDAP